MSRFQIRATERLGEYLVVDSEKHDECVHDKPLDHGEAIAEVELRNAMVERGETQLAGRYGCLA